MRIPVLWAANECDEHAPLERAKALFDELSSRDKRMRVLPGAHGDMRQAEVEAQETWLLGAMAQSYSRFERGAA